MNYNTSTIVSKLMLSDGSTISFIDESYYCSTRMGSGEELKNDCASVGLDLNGFKGPNKKAKIYFGFGLQKEESFLAECLRIQI